MPDVCWDIWWAGIGGVWRFVCRRLGYEDFRWCLLRYGYGNVYGTCDRYVDSSIIALSKSNQNIGPIVGGYVAEKAGWRWTLYIILISGIGLPILFFFLEETYKPIILKRRAIRLGLPLPTRPDPKTALKLIFTITIARPTVMLIREPIVQCVSLYSAFAFAVLFGFFEAFPFAFSREHQFGLGQTGVCFTGVGIGLLCGCALFLLWDKTFYLPKLIKGHGYIEPEARMIPAMIGAVLMPIGLFW